MTSEIEPVVREMPATVSAEYIQALALFQDGVIPKSAMYQRPMRGGKISTYIKHTWVTDQLRKAYADMWEMDVLREQAFEDYSALAIVKFTTYAMGPDGLVKTSITEAGAFMDETKKMPKAYVIAAAVSRGLVKCVMRRTGCGASLYEEDFAPTAKDAANTLFRYARSCGIKQEDLIARYKEEGISSENVLEKFAEAYSLIYTMKEEKDRVDVESLFTKKEPEPKPGPAQEKKDIILSDDQVNLLKTMVKVFEIDPSAALPQRVKTANTLLAKHEYGELDSLDNETCQAIIKKLEEGHAKKKERKSTPQVEKGPLADSDLLAALLSWAESKAGLTEESVLNVLNTKLDKEGKPECLAFEFVPYTLKECKEIVAQFLAE